MYHKPVIEILVDVTINETRMVRDILDHNYKGVKNIMNNQSKLIQNKMESTRATIILRVADLNILSRRSTTQMASHTNNTHLTSLPRLSKGQFSRTRPILYPWMNQNLQA